MAEPGPLAALFDDLRARRISRRTFMQRAAALGVGMPVILYLLNGVPSVAAMGAQGSTGAAARPQQAGGSRPMSGTQNQKRGDGGKLNLLQWQAPTVLNPQVATGDKDILAAQPVMEPLMCYLPDGSLSATLVKDVPSQANGLLAKDLTSVTYNLLEGVTWSDGQPFTAKDVVFTWQWIMDQGNNSVNYATYQPIKDVAAVTDTQVKVTFNGPRLDWYVPFTGYAIGPILPAHILSAGKSANQGFAQKPIGTGPFVVDTFRVNDQVTYKANDKYREPNKPYFATVNLKGGGDAASAARAVLETGDYDFAWNLQVEPAILNQMEKSGGKGKVYAPTGTSIERINFNFSDPNKEVDGQRSYWKQPHPFLTDKAVRQALSLACNRQLIANQFYQAPGEHPTANVLSGLAAYESKDTSWEFSIAKAKQVLDAAGWKMNGNTREKDGVKLQLAYTTTINSVRQKTQAVVKQAWDELGVKVNLKQVDSGIFFDTGAGNDLGYHHMYTDIQMYTSTLSTPYPLPFMQAWYSNNGENIAQKENGWSKSNIQRYNNPDYDKLYAEASTATDPEKFAQLIIQMNDVVINDFATVPLVQRAADKYAVSNALNNDNIAVSAVEDDYWNIANWNKTTQ